MNSFKEMIEDDIKNTFLNAEEFGEIHNIDGTEVLAVVDICKNGEYKKTEEMKDFQNGIYQSMTTIMYQGAKEELPRIGYQMNLDGIDYYVTSASYEDGMHVINLVRNEG